MPDQPAVMEDATERAKLNLRQMINPKPMLLYCAVNEIEMLILQHQHIFKMIWACTSC
jgi:hypothetical protein